MKLMTRICTFAIMLCLLMLCVAPTEAMAATDYTGKTQTFKIRESGSCDATGVTVTMRSTSADGKTGTITFNGKAKAVGNLFTGVIPSGTVYTYKISSLKEGGKITLTWKSGLITNSYMQTMTAKIHIDSSKGCSIANIWKIDTFRYKVTLLSEKTNFYFRYN